MQPRPTLLHGQNHHHGTVVIRGPHRSQGLPPRSCRPPGAAGFDWGGSTTSLLNKMRVEPVLKMLRRMRYEESTIERVCGCCMRP